MLDYPGLGRGWAAEADRQPARILRTNVLFGSVRVSAGRHVVVFRFAPFLLASLRDAFLDVWARRELPAIDLLQATGWLLRIPLHSRTTPRKTPNRFHSQYINIY